MTKPRQRITKHALLFFLTSTLVSLYSCGRTQLRPDLSQPSVVYGRDNRVDFTSQTPAIWNHLSQNVALLVENQNLMASSGTVGLNTQTLKESHSLCEKEKFSSQPTAGFCTGFLIKENIIITAGHCMRNQKMCKDTSFVFDFKSEPLVSGSTAILKPSTVYSCNQILFSETSDSTDIAVIELDRIHPKFQRISVEDTIPQDGQSLTVIGHPNGLPMKLDAGGKVRHSKSSLPHFVADLDTFGGSSGSPVFDKSHGHLVGMLIRGEKDYEWDPENQCQRSLKCKTGSCRGEDVLRAEAIPAAYR